MSEGKGLAEAASTTPPTAGTTDKEKKAVATPIDRLKKLLEPRPLEIKTAGIGIRG